MFKVLDGLEGESLIVGLFKQNGNLSKALQELDKKLNNQLTKLIKSGEISSAKNSVAKLYTFDAENVKRIYFVGLGKEKEFTFQKAMEAFGHAFQAVQQDQKKIVSVQLSTFIGGDVEEVDAAHALAEAFALSTYKIKNYKQRSSSSESSIEAVHVLTDADKAKINAALTAGYVYGRGTNSARTLVNMPSNLLTATELANYSIELAKKYSFEIEILEKKDMEEMGMGGILAVNKGSSEPPKMIVLKYQGKKIWDDAIGLVGKGITYDTGGYSLKPRDGLVNMKTDMAGAAAVLGAMEIIGEIKPKQNVVAVIPATDNMIGSGAMKPDDVIVSLSGKTIEILNTDAEGRLALADGITYAKQHGAKYIIDVATLTGGVIVALGKHTTGAMTNNEKLYDQLLKASVECNERIWRLPIFEDDRERVKNSKMADLNNSPGREGHAIMGGAFLAEFAEDTPWVHLDIAGTSTTAKKGPLGPEGATGVMTRTLAAFVEKFVLIKS